MDDLEPIALLQLGVSPAVARHDIAIQFDGHAVGLHAEDLHERREGKRSASIAKITLVPIDLKFHFTEARVKGSADGTSRLENLLTHSRCSGVSGTGRPRTSLISFSASSGDRKSVV